MGEIVHNLAIYGMTCGCCTGRVMRVLQSNPEVLDAKLSFEKDSGIISINGAAAHKANPGDKLIIATYAEYNESELETYHPTLVYLDESNKMTITKNSIAIQAA